MLCAGFLLVSLAAFGARIYTDEVNAAMARLVVRTPDAAQLNAIGLYGMRCTRLVDETLAVRDIPKQKITLAETGDSGAAGDWTVFRHPDAPETRFAEDLFALLLRRRLTEITGRTVRQAPLLRLVTAGLTYRFVRGRRSLSGYFEADYEIARNQFLRREFPDIRKLLENDPPQGDAFLELFRMHADLVTAWLARPRSGLLLDILLAEQSGEKTADAVDRLTRPIRSPGETLQLYYERRIPVIAGRQKRAGGEDAVRERLRELETVPVIGLDAGSAVRRIRIEDLPTILTDYTRDVYGLKRLEQRFRELRLAAPFLLRDAIEDYARAIAWLSNGEVKRFRTAIRDARARFEDALARQKRLNALLDTYDAHQRSPLQRFAPYLRILRRYRTLAGQLYPEDPFRNTPRTP